MTEQLSSILSQHADAFHQAIPRYRNNKYVQIVVLRETKSYAIFTTEGQTLDVERLQAGIDNAAPLDRIVMYKRKQIAPERRTGKALLRERGILSATPIKDTKSKIAPADCQIMGGSCGHCPDCILYGFAATTGTASQRARVLTDSGFLVRGSSAQVMRDITLNAIQDTIAGGIAGSAFATRENLLPQVFIPTVETLLDVTATEFIYVLGNILKTTRYGAESNREGFIRNHILGIYFSDVELFSNLELTQRYYDALAKEGQLDDYLSLSQLTASWLTVEKPALAAAVGRKRKVENLAGLLEEVSALYSDEAALTKMLRTLNDEALNYVRKVKSQGAAVDSGEASADIGGEEAEA